MSIVQCGYWYPDLRIAAFGSDSALFDGYPQVYGAGFSIVARCVTICTTLLGKSLAHRVLRRRARELSLGWLSRKAKIRLTSTRLKEIAMDTSKVIELGNVSEETKGLKGQLEDMQEPNTGFNPF
jgi:hypothetical protein